MDIVITAWALDSYLDQKGSKVFTSSEYKSTIRPDVLLLRQYPNNPKFNNSKFWSFATDASSNRIPGGHKMKWHQVGPGKVQLRTPVAITNGRAYLCQAYVKENDKQDKRMMAKFKVHLQLISQGQHTERGRL